jgi:transglutaminase-like putative cysteine protease
MSFSVADTNPVYGILTLLGLIACWMGSVRPVRPAPRKLINTVLLLVIVIGGVEVLRVGIGVSAFAVFVSLLLLVKLLDLRNPRDDGQVLVLCLSLMVAAVLTSNSFITGVVMLIESVLLLRAFVLFQVFRVVRMGRAQDARIDRRSRIDIRSMMIASGFLCAVIGSVLFIVLPRNVGTQAFGQWGAGRSVSGFNDKVELGRPGRISTSSKPVLDLTVRDRDGMNIGSESSPPIYMRGAVLEVYRDGNWERSSIMRVPLTDRIRTFPPDTTLKPRGNFDNSRWDQEFHVSMRPVSDGPVYLFTPWRPVEFHVLDEPMRLGYDFSRGLFLKDGLGGAIRYSVRTVNDEFRVLPISDDAIRSEVTPTQIAPEIAELAQEIVTEGGVDPDPNTRSIRDDAAAVRLLETYLRSRYKYTLDAQPVPSGLDATNWFLFEHKQGHCEYYASALTLLARSLGIPTRVVTGYIASDYNAVTGQYTVRESNAHAWVEAEVAPGQWRTFDGTPPSDFHNIHVPEPSIFRSISKMYESIEFLWGRAVVGYDSDARDQIIGEQVGDFGLTRMGDRLLERLAAGRSRLISRAALVATIVFAGSMFVGLLLMRSQSLLPLLRGVWEALLARLGLGSSRVRSGADGEQRLERAIDRVLRRVGSPKPAWLPLKQHLHDRAKDLEQSPELYDALSRAADLLYSERFAKDPSHDTGSIGRVISALRRSEKLAGSHSPNRA